MNISKPVRVAFTIIGLITIILAVIIFFTNINVPLIPNLNNKNDVPYDEEYEYQQRAQYSFDDFLAESDEVTFDELKKENPELTNSASIVDTEQREKFVETTLNNREPVLHDVLILPEGITSRAMVITIGDYVKFSNELDRSITIENLSITDTNSKDTIIDSKDNRSFGFDFIGEFTFKVDGVEFKVFVEKYVE